LNSLGGGGFSAQANVGFADVKANDELAGRSQKTAWMLRSLLEE
jgi:hypothetical protein